MMCEITQLTKIITGGQSESMIPHFYKIFHNQGFETVLLSVRPLKNFGYEVIEPFTPQKLELQERKGCLRKYNFCLILSSGLYFEHAVNYLCDLTTVLDICHDKKATFFCFTELCLLQPEVELLSKRKHMY